MGPARLKWTDAELDLLRQIGATIPWPELGEHLPGRTLNSIRAKADELGVKLAKQTRLIHGRPTKPWTVVDEATLIMLAGTISRREIAQRLGRSETAISQHARRLKIRLRPTETIRYVAKVLGLDRGTVARRRDAMKLRFRRKSKRGNMNARGASDDDIRAIARSILEDENPSPHLKTSARRLRAVLEECGNDDT